MGSEWIEVSLDEISDRIGDGLHGTPVYSDSGDYFFINGNNLENGQIVFKDSTNKVDYEQYIKHKKELGENTLLVSINGTIGNVALYNGEPVLLGKSACYINLKKGISKHFVQFVLSGHIFQEYIQRCSTGSTIKNVSLKMMREFRFMMPESEEAQDNAVEVLKNLNQKITLNRQINQTLEQMAQTLFKSWFVDFDPVIDNALDAGNDIPDTLQERAEQRRLLRVKADFKPLPAETRALFPSEFEETELGWVPKGWEVGCIADFGSIVCGKTPSKDKNEFYGGTIPFIKIPDMHNQVFIVETSDSLSLDGSNSQIKKLIPKDSICVSCIATVGLVAIANKASHTNQQINSIVPFKPYFRDYLYFSMMDKYELFHDLASGGSTTLNMNTSTFSKIQMLKPANEILLSYQKLSSSFLSKNLANELESQSLIKIRDTLLPKLISGELVLDALPELPELAEAR